MAAAEAATLDLLGFTAEEIRTDPFAPSRPDYSSGTGAAGSADASTLRTSGQDLLTGPR